MTSVLGLDEPAVDELCRQVAPHGRLWKANLLGPGNIVVSGERGALEHLEPIATALGAARVIPLAVAGAFHSDLMKPADAELAEVLAAAPLQSPRIPVYSNVDATPHSEPDDLRRTLVAQVIGGVRWEDSMRRMLADGFDTFYEIGPGRVLTGLLEADRPQGPVHEHSGTLARPASASRCAGTCPAASRSMLAQSRIGYDGSTAVRRRVADEFVRLRPSPAAAVIITSLTPAPARIRANQPQHRMSRPWPRFNLPPLPPLAVASI